MSHGIPPVPIAINKGPQVRQRAICLLVVVSMILGACTTQIGTLEKVSCSRATAVTYTNCLVATLDLTPQDQKSELTQELIVALVAVNAQADNEVISHDEAITKADDLVKEYVEKERNENGKKVAIGILAVVAAAGAYALSRTGGGGGGYTPASSYAPSSSYDTPLMCSAAPAYSKRCSVGKACGNTCIDADDTCHVGRGTACNLTYHSYP
jgi:hypothetical protein